MSTITAKCEGVNATGYGIVSGNERKYLISGLLPGEEAILDLGSDGIGSIVKLLQASPLRQKPKCPRYSECGGCHLQHADYSFQLDLKTRAVKESFKNNGIDPETVLPCIGMKDPYHYRNKIQMVVSEKGRKVMAGFYEENTHRIVNVDDCTIQDETANAIVRTCRFLMEKHQIPAFDENRGVGLMRHIMVKRSDSTGQVLVILVTVSEMFPGRNNFITDLRKAHPEITSIVQNVNDRATSVVLGDFERVLFGPGTIEDEMHGLKFVISPRTFYQINAKQADILYQKALEFAKPKPDDLMVDAYSGVGTIALFFAGHVKRVEAVEINPVSVKNGIQNARLNHIRNVRFTAADAKDFLLGMAEEGIVPDLLTVDPPRSGLDPAFLDALEKVRPGKIVYISCDPNTLSRDLVRMIRLGYSVKRAQPLDMFCQTFHVETVVSLGRNLPEDPKR